MLKLNRIDSNNNMTLGVMTYANKFWTTVERPWLYNAPDISCIPTGIYTMRRFFDVHQYRSSKRIDSEYVWEVCEVPHRTVILFHVANYPHNVKGCIGLGMGILKGRAGVSGSRNAIREFYESTKDINEMKIVIS